VDVRNASVLCNSDLLCHAMKFFNFLNEPANYVNLNYIYIYISKTSKHFLGMLLKNSPKDGQLVRNMSQERRKDKAVLYAAPFQIRDASEK